MGDELHCHEPSDHTVLLTNQATCNIFQQRGWLVYYLSLQRFDEEIALQFHNTLHEGYATVKGVRIEFLEEIVAEVTGLLTIGERWSEDMDV